MFTKVLYLIAFIWLLFSFFKDKRKTKEALQKAWKSFEKILPSVLTVLLLIGFVLTILDAETISKLIGKESGILGLFIAGIIGSITLIPGFVALPLAASLISAGAGYTQIAMFISTLMMVGIVTFPLEAKYFGRDITLKRNILSLAVAIATSLIIGLIMR